MNNHMRNMFRRTILSLLQLRRARFEEGLTRRTGT